MNLSLPEGVVLERTAIVDADRDSVVPLNPSASWILSELLSGDSPTDIASSIEAATGVDRSAVLNDVNDLIDTLERAQLLNIDRGRQRLNVGGITAWIFGIIRTVQTGNLATRRHRLDDASALPLLKTVATAALRPLAASLLVACAPAFVTIALLAGAVPAGLAAATALSAAVSIVAHEFGHAYAAVRRNARPYLVTRGLGVFVVTAGHSSTVALAGPVLPSSVGVAGIIVALALESPTLLFLALPWLAHLANLTTVSRDGRQLLPTSQ